MRIFVHRVTLTDNAKYVKRGSDMMIQYDPGWEDDLKQANKSKVGAPFQYADGLIMLASSLHVALGIPYRQLSGLVSMMLTGYNSPHYTVLWRRAKQLDVRIEGNTITVSDSKKPVTMIADATGITQCSRGEWMREKWKVRRGFVKLHLLIDADTKKIMAAAITDDRTGDSPMLKHLLGTRIDSGEQAGKEQADEKPDAPMSVICRDDTLKERFDCIESHRPNMIADGVPPVVSQDTKPQTHGAQLFADGAYASRDNMKLCKCMGIRSLIPLRIDSTARGKGTGDAWGMAVREQLGGSKDSRIGRMSSEEKEENKTYWKNTVGYNKRWLVEIVISAFKRMFGDHMQSRKWENMVQELKLKILLYNRWQEAAAG